MFKKVASLWRLQVNGELDNLLKIVEKKVLKKLHSKLMVDCENKKCKIET